MSDSLASLIIKDLDRIQLLLNCESPHQNKIFGSFKIIKIFLSHRYLPVFIYRVAYALSKYKIYVLSMLLEYLNLVVFGCEIPSKIKIGPGFFLPHPNGVVLGASEIKENVTIFQGVTLGAQTPDYKFDVNVRPSIRSNVQIGAGAKILGPVTIGEGAIIGANSVVISDVPSHETWTGVPAKKKGGTNG